MSIKLSSKNRASTIARNKYYKDLDLGLRVHPGLLDIRPLEDIEAVKNSVKNLVMTGGGDRPFHPEIGSSVFNYLFELGNNWTALGIQSAIKKVLDIYEPRIDRVSVEVIDQLDRNSYFITIGFRVKAPNIATEVNFYLERLR